MTGAQGYDVIRPEDDPRRDYNSIYDASGRGDLLPDLIARLARGGEVVLAGFYPEPLSFSFPPAFLREARLRVAAEWQPDDLVETRRLIETGALSLAGLVTHSAAASDAPNAYATAFGDPACLKMILNWKDAA
jgi:3-hydroxyethyl bacteriochlorophyllide a dehydrogenase